MNEIEELQNWYHSQCNDDWEHTYGIRIETLDNPGWSIAIQLSNTYLENKSYVEISYGVGDDAETSGNEWIVTLVETGVFKGYGGPHKLNEIIKYFLVWAKSHAK